MSATRARITPLVAAVALAIGGCGEEEAPPAAPPSAGPPPASTTDEGARGDDGKPSDSGGGGGAGQPASTEPEAGPGACVFDAPPQRLAESRIPIELTGVPCDEGKRLAKAAALGQPAGANLALNVAGFDCEPSTKTKGANVSYVCTDGSREARFDVAWTADGP